MAQCVTCPVAVVYYSTLDPNTQIKALPVGNTLLTNINGPLYRDPQLTTAYPNERVGVSQGVYITSNGASLAGQFTLFLIDGTVTCHPAGSAEDIGGSRFVFPPGVYYFEIVSGTTAYFRKPGYVRLTVGAQGTGLRTFEIFLDIVQKCVKSKCR